MTSPGPSAHFPLPTSHFPDGLVHRELSDILSQPEYNRSHGPGPVDQARDWVVDKFMRLVGWLSELFGLGSGTAGRIASIVFACLVILGFLAMVVIIIRRLAGRAQEPPEEDVGAKPYQLPSAGPLIRQAERLAGEGNYRGAFGCAYLASISRLDEAGALHHARSRTNWEYMGEMAGRGLDLLTDTLRPLTLDFDRKFYGREPCTIEDYHSALSAFQRTSAAISPHYEGGARGGRA